MDQPLARQPVADAGLGEDVDRALLQQAGADAGTQVLRRAPLQHDAVDAGQAEQPRQQQSRGPATDNSNLCAHATFLRAAAGDFGRWPQCHPGVGRQSESRDPGNGMDGHCHIVALGPGYFAGREIPG